MLKSIWFTRGGHPVGSSPTQHGSKRKRKGQRQQDKYREMLQKDWQTEQKRRGGRKMQQEAGIALAIHLHKPPH